MFATYFYVAGELNFYDVLNTLVENDAFNEKILLIKHIYSSALSTNETQGQVMEIICYNMRN